MIYMIEAVGLGLVKIGRAKNPVDRIEALRAGCPAPLQIVGIRDWPNEMEWYLHQACAHAKVNGEWFREADIPDIINDLCCPYCDPRRAYDMALQDVGFHIVPRDNPAGTLDNGMWNLEWGSVDFHGIGGT